MKILTCIIAFLLIVQFAASQGFDWQYSPRLPFETPSFFIGAALEGNYYNHFGDFPIREFGEILCCNHKTGDGSGLDAGILVENWIKGDFAINAALKFSIVNGGFTSENSVPIKGGGELISKYTSTTTMYYVALEPSAKWRLLGSHFWISIGISGKVYVGSSLNAIMEIPASDTGELRQVELEGSLPPMNAVYIAPILSIGYNGSTGLGQYFSPYARVEFPAFDAASHDEWRFWKFSFGIAFYKGVFR